MLVAIQNRRALIGGRVCDLRAEDGVRFDVEYAFATAGDHAFEQNVHAARSVGDGTHKHRHIGASDRFDVTRHQQFAGEVGGAGAENIGDDELTMRWAEGMRSRGESVPMT